jgi:putative DNA primase/helicase
MHESFLGRENRKLTGELTAELTGILSWSLDGLDRLNRQGKFTEPRSSTDSILAVTRPPVTGCGVRPGQL